MAKIINGSSLALALANYLCTNAYMNDTAQDVLIMVGNWIDEAQEITVPKWIPVSERLPEIGDRCLCNVKSFAFPGSFYQAILKYDKYGFIEGCIYTDDVTHWMPLPEPPKEC